MKHFTDSTISRISLFATIIILSASSAFTFTADAAAADSSLPASLQRQNVRSPKFRHLGNTQRQYRRATPPEPVDSDSLQLAAYIAFADSVTSAIVDSTLLNIDSIYLAPKPGPNIVFAPWVFSGYRSLSNTTDHFRIHGNKPLPKEFDIAVYETPLWLRNSMTAKRIEQEFIYRNMFADYTRIDYAYWNLPVPPRLPNEDYSFAGYLKRMKIDIENTPSKIVTDNDIDKRHWLHVFNPGLQFSQAYVSANWYQGGTPSLSLLLQFIWNVQLNQVYHPNLLFTSNFSYKLGLTSLQNNELHKYTISDDILQYNLKAGVKARKNWFYSLTMQFKTQMFHNYPVDSDVRTASFLSPGEFNVGLGMTYNKTNAANTISLSASIAPISYNLKTCIDPLVDPAQFNITPGKKTFTEIGSNAEITFSADLSSNISYKTRLFFFTSYKMFQGDWENTFVFRINSFLTTQVYAHLRFDSSSDPSTSRWRHWMLKELLSLGLSYYFSTTGK